MHNNNDLPPESVDVLVIGNGPVGATLTALLGRYGVDTLVIDKNHDVLSMPRAIALDNEALRILQLAGLDEDAFDTVVIPHVKMHCPIVGQFGQANTRGRIDGHHKLVTFYQPDLEQAMRRQAGRFANLRSLGGLELREFVQDAAGVTATLQDESGCTHVVRCRYLVGADGASSRVRGLIGQEFNGQSYSEDWLIVDAGARHGQAIDHVEFLCDHRRPTPHMPAPGGRERWEFMLRPGESRDQMEDPARIGELLAPWIDPDKLTIERKAVYRFHARCCDSFQQGRVFLVGDAAHITPPFVGQGLVAGLRDVANLAWKLSWVLRGNASPRILDSYDEERRPHAQAMIDLAKLMGRLVMPGNALAAAAIHGFMKVLRSFPPARRHFEELDIKPKSRFDQGLFVRGRRRRSAATGALFPQAWVRSAGRLCLSDDLLGDRLQLVGLGTDPRRWLDAAQQARWQELGGDFLEIGHGRGNGNGSFAEALDGTLLDAWPQPTLAVVRPDRVIMHQGAPEQAGELLSRCQALLQA
ncbi:bifunctional 3-(3-hydroxy-phenyl)propionate/3-hydroxycinnamic acid hydroxylase [Pseudomonas sp. PDNC002]|uniref:bifunctional 3-(3-hydroxy-phenyl)propionate/3-hydroxycinnamic acid hydroxylase n=1 Tax=Pseudomonas sp. PDNC002 TaxID=2811422 RepID=UPI001965CE1E|nr:bifunctional 3-(3-hydroxy-phenyl)propionate/3-hydroxycinnamic acid hydroxylase [Pseudomonas sp. PDNC002]QRY77257.1 bifunctional 3-(3-hydroxy-phenyl)propionate/3-hydroxycinnamic acid hydroxylase [Pseudomonas sp. PDNC002]